MMKYYKYSFMGYMFDHTAGIVIANSVEEAKQKVREYYKNTDHYGIKWSTLKCELVSFENGVYEVYFDGKRKEKD